MAKKVLQNFASTDGAVDTAPQMKNGDFRYKLWLYLFPLLLFFAITAQSRFMAVVMCAFLIFFTVGAKPFGRLKSRFSPLMLAVILFVAMTLIAGLYSKFGSYAVEESAKTVSAAAVFVISLAMTGKRSVKYILAVLASICAVISLLCIDAASLNLLTKGYAVVMKLFLYDISGFFGYEQGIRITGIFGNPNVSAGILAFGILISCYLIKAAQSEKERASFCVILGINAMGFLLSFSLGAIVAFALSCVIFLLCEEKSPRTSLFFLMLITVFSSLLLSFAIFPFLGTASVFPLVFTLLNGVLICALERLCSAKLYPRLEGKYKPTFTVVATLVALTVIYAVLAFNLTGAQTVPAGQSLSRAEYLAPGDYGLSLSSEGGAIVHIYSQTTAELMMHTNTVLYDGGAEATTFTVPEDSRVTWFVFSSSEGVRLDSAILSDGTTLKLGYKLLPDFAANRLQGLFANQNFVQRLVFFKDGIKLFKLSPVFGRGLGAVEGWLTSVQDFYYESVYIHNHFIQVLDEMGILGLALFLFMLISALVTLIKNRKDASAPLFALLIACTAMMTFHSITEVVWSTGMYQTVCFMLFVVIIVKYAKPHKMPKKKILSPLLATLMCSMVVCFGVLIAGNLIASKILAGYQPADREDLLSTMIKLDTIDCYDDSFYKSTYMMNAVNSEKFEQNNQATIYAKQLLATGEYRACTDVAMYYYLPKQMLPQMFEASRTAIAQEASNPDSWNLQLDFYQQAVPYIEQNKTQNFLSGVMETLDYYNKYNTDRMQQIVITEKNQIFVDAVKTLYENGASNSEAYAILSYLCPPQQ